jgi:hypothetical protein
MPFVDPPPFAAFRHCDSRDGHEVAFLRTDADAVIVEGHVSALEEGEPFAVAYRVELDSGWRTRRARVRGKSLRGVGELEIEADGEGRWRVDGAPASDFDGCLDLDLEASSLTNAFPVRRLELAVGEGAETPAVWVRALDLRVERLEQSYKRIGDADDGHERFRYAARAAEFTSQLEYDASGLVVAYPGIAVRSA